VSSKRKHQIMGRGARTAAPPPRPRPSVCTDLSQVG
jgi:hypothetical protein